MRSATTQLLIYRFAPGASLEGGLLGAVERFADRTSLRIVDVLFVRANSDSGEVDVLSVAGGDKLAAATLEFRLDERARRAVSTHALEAHPELARLADALEPGEAVAAVLVEHRWIAALAEAAARSEGTAVGAEFIEADSLVEIVPRLLAALNA